MDRRPQPLKVFLSYSRVDVDRAREIADELETWAVDTWFDEHSLRAGADWEKKIIDAFESVDVVVALLSKDALEGTGFFHRELEMAAATVEKRAGEFAVVPARLDGSIPPPSLARFHWLDLSESDPRRASGSRSLLETLWSIADERGRISLLSVPRVPPRVTPIRAPSSLEGADVRYVSALSFDPGKAKPPRRRLPPLLWGDRVRAGDSPDGGVGIPQSAVGDTESEPLAVRFIELGASCSTLIRSAMTGRAVLVDTGRDEQVLRYLQWLADGPRSPVHLDALVISQGTRENYEGLRHLLKAPWLTIGCLYHNGVLRARDLKQRFSQRSEDRTRIRPIRTGDDLRRHLAEVDCGLFGRLLTDALESDRIGDVRAIARSDRYLPGFGEESPDFAIEILAPVDGSGGIFWPERARRTDDPSNQLAVVMRVHYEGRSLLIRPMMHALGDETLIAADESPYDAAGLRSELAKFCYHSTRDFDKTLPRRVDMAGAIVAVGLRDPKYRIGYSGLITVGSEIDNDALWVTGTDNRLLDEEPDWISELRRALDYLERISDGAQPATNLPQRAADKFIELLRMFGGDLDSRYVVHVRLDANRAIIAKRTWRGPWQLSRFEQRDGRLEFVPDEGRSHWCDGVRLT